MLQYDLVSTSLVPTDVYKKGQKKTKKNNIQPLHSTHFAIEEEVKHGLKGAYVSARQAALHFFFLEQRITFNYLLGFLIKSKVW